MIAENPRATVGDNEAPDYAKQITAQMARDYPTLEPAVNELLAQAREAPKEINDDETAASVGKIIKDLRDVTKRIEAYHGKEKEPFLRGGQGVDQFFFGLWEKCARRIKTAKGGAADILQARVDDYVQRKIAEQRRINEENQRKAQEAADNARRAREAEEQAQRDAVAAAARARKPENVEAHEQKAAGHEQAASTARIDEEVARDNLLDARQMSGAKSADLVRYRDEESGVLLTAKQVPYVEMVDASKLDPVALWPFIKDKEKLAALTAWAKITQHKRQMAGAIIEMRDTGVIR